MKRYFVIGIDPTTKEQQKSIQEWLDSQDGSWWHWIDGMWLVVTNDSSIKVSEIRDEVVGRAPGVTSLVLEVKSVTWSGYGPKTEKRDMFKWIKSLW